MKRTKKGDKIIDSYITKENGKTYLCYIFMRSDGTTYRHKSNYATYSFDDTRLSSIEGLTRRFEGGVTHALSSLAKSLDDQDLAQRYVNQTYDQVKSFATKATTTKKIEPPKDMQGYINNMFKKCITDVVTAQPDVNLEKTFERILEDEKSSTNPYLVNAINSIYQTEQFAEAEVELE